MLLREEVVQLQEEVHLLRQMKDMLTKDLEETQGGCSANLLSATELRVQLGDKEQELDRAKEALQGQKQTDSLVVLPNLPEPPCFQHLPTSNVQQIQLSKLSWGCYVKPEYLVIKWNPLCLTKQKQIV